MKTILVTGANRGIGKEISRQLSRMGHLVLLCARDFETAQTIAREISAESKPAVPLQLDVSSPESIEQLAKDVTERFGKLDVLINNAGVFDKQHDFGALAVAEEVVSRTLAVNFYGPWRMARAFADLLRKSDDGRIVNISSEMGKLNEMGGGHFAYRLSKTALNNLTINLSHDFASSVRVNSMCPGWVRTEMGGPGASRDVSQGADTAVWLATADDVPTGKFFYDRKILAW